jgi:hypothetical protein
MAMDKMSELAGRLMFNKKAMAFAKSIPPRAPVGPLSLKYAALSAYGDKQSEAACLAIEHHIRLVATQKWDDEEVVAALDRVEAAIAFKKEYMKKISGLTKKPRRKKK